MIDIAAGINVMDSEQKNWLSYEQGMTLVRTELDKALYSAPRIIRTYTEHLKASGGKFIRTAALLACSGNDEGKIPLNAVRFATAVELFHLATLVHDDVMDNADLRRGNVTLQKKYGKKTAVICGDYLFSIALKMASEVTGREKYLDLVLPDYIGRVCLGELNQHISSGFLDLSVRKYLKIISGKTAALFEASCLAGAILSGLDREAAAGYRRLGRWIGMIFQITDDCKDFEATENIAGKPVQSDFEQGVVTLPLIHTFRRLADFRGKAGKGGLTRKEINEAVAAAGGLDYSRGVSGEYYKKASEIINGLDAGALKKERLRAVLERAGRIA